MFRTQALLTAVVLSAAATRSHAQTPFDLVEAPQLWFSGDTHVHSQFCIGPVQFPDFTTEQLLFLQESFELDVVFNQFWNPPYTEEGVQRYLEEYAPQITGEPFLCPNEPEKQMLYGVEVSGFKASQFGHLHGLNLTDGFFPTDSVYTGPILDHFRDQPGAVTGYAHIHWPGKVENFEAFPDFEYPHLPYMAPIDVAHGKVDFLEVLGHTTGGWKSLYYKLLNAGLRTGLSGASDNCGWLIGYGRTYAQVDETPMTAKSWLRSLAQGRTSISLNIHKTARFLELTIDGEVPGSQIILPQPKHLSVDARLHTSEGSEHAATGEFELIFNGKVVDTQKYKLPEGGVAIYKKNFAAPRSGWVAVRTEHTHTAPVYVYVADEPIAEPDDTAYFVRYAELLEANIENFELGDSGPDVVAYIRSAAAALQARAALNEELPFGVATHGDSTPSSLGPLRIGVSAAPVIGTSDFRVTCVGAPPEAKGFLVISRTPDLSGNDLDNATIYLDANAPYLAAQVFSTEGGYAELTFPTPDYMAGGQLWMQYVWVNPDPAAGGELSASPGMLVTFHEAD